MDPELLVRGAQLAALLAAASYGFCVDAACPGTAADPVACTYTCCGLVPTRCGTDALVSALGNGEASLDDGIVTHLVALPYATAAGFCMPNGLLMCIQPCSRTPAQAATMRAKVVQAGVVPAAVKSIKSGGLPGLMVLEQFCPFDPLGAVSAGAVEAIAEAGVISDDTKFNVEMSLFGVSVLATLAASEASGLSPAKRIELANTVLQFVSSPRAAGVASQYVDVMLANKMVNRINAAAGIASAVVAGHGAPVPLSVSNPADNQLRIMCAGTRMVNTFAENHIIIPCGDCSAAPRIKALYMVGPPARVALGAPGTPSLAVPGVQVMITNPLAMQGAAMSVSTVGAHAGSTNFPAQPQMAAPANALNDWLVKNSLTDSVYATSLRSAGVNSPADFQHLTAEDVKSLPLNPVQRGKLNMALGR